MSVTDEKPLYVQVAEALGWEQAVHPNIIPGDGWKAPFEFDMDGETIDAGDIVLVHALPRYDTDWSATGPLIEKYGITVTCSHFEDGVPIGHAAGLHAHALGREPGPIATGDSPLLAVCNLILALKEAGRL